MGRAITLPRIRVRRKRKKPWSHTTRVLFAMFVLDVALTVSVLVPWPTPTSAFDVFCGCWCTGCCVLSWRWFRESLERDRRGD